MQLTYSLVKRLFFSNFRVRYKKTAPLIITSPDKKATYITDYKSKILQLNGTKYKYSVREQLVFAAAGHDFTINFDENNIFCISFRDEFVRKIYNFKQFENFLIALNKEYQQKNLKQLKKDKIKNLKQHTIESKIKAIAKAEQFEYMIWEYATHTKLAIKLPKDKCVTVSIPHAKFQKILQNLHPFVHEMMKILQEGSLFNTFSEEYEDRYWTKPENLG